MTETATLNITYNGLSADVASPVFSDTSDEDIKRIAAEEKSLPPESFTNFVVDRFPDTGMIYLRPKVPFG
jgi:hypothetical protein